MAKKKLNRQELQVQNEKKLNKGRQPGFRYDVSQVENDEFIIIKENVSTEDLLYKLDYSSQYVGEMYPKVQCICLVCDELSFKLLNPTKTLWAYEPYFRQYIIFYRFDEYDVKYLVDNLTSSRIRAYPCYALTFTKTTLPKFCPKWSEYKINNLPPLTSSEIEKISFIDNDLAKNDGYYYQINKLSDKYRIPQAVCGIMAKSVIPINARVVLEKVLQVMSHSTAIIDNSELEQPYRCSFKAFCKDLTFTGRKVKKQDIVINAFNEFIRIGLIDDFNIDDDGNLIFSSHLMTKHIRQQIKRNMGYYAQIPGTKQAPFIATFIDYLWWIINCPACYEKITISLETLFNRHLDLSRLLTEHRNGEIAKILNLLRKVGQQYGLLQVAPDTQDFTGADVKYLVQHRTELHTFLQIKSSEKEVKEER